MANRRSGSRVHGCGDDRGVCTAMRAAEALRSDCARATSPARGSIAAIRRGMRIMVRHASDGIGGPDRDGRSRAAHSVASGRGSRAKRPPGVNFILRSRAALPTPCRPRDGCPRAARYQTTLSPPARVREARRPSGGALAGAGRPKRRVWGRGCSGIRPGRAHKKSISGRNRAIGCGLQVQRPMFEIGGEMDDHVPARRLLPATRDERRLRCDA